MLATTCTKFPSTSVVYFEKGWKFKQGNDMAWASIDFKDSDWDSISVRQAWESQGHQIYDGFAWYRTTVYIPSSLKMNKYLQDSVLFSLGKIDDGDQFFLNGVFVGQNNKKLTTRPSDSVFMHDAQISYSRERKYLLPVDDPRIHWDQENLIAIRVFDSGGAGGMYNGIPSVCVADINNYIDVDVRVQPYELIDNQFSNQFKVTNTSTFLELNGIFSVVVESWESSKEEVMKEEHVELHPGTSLNVSMTFPRYNEMAIVKFYFKPAESAPILVGTDDLPYILTPRATEAPKINGPKVYGCRPGHQFLFSIPTTGLRPMTFEAMGLPNALAVDHKTGIIAGEVTSPGDYKVMLKATNEKGSSWSELLIKIGDQIALTPPMGWNSWNCWGESVDQEKVLQSARAFKEKGLMDHGWAFVNIDGGWQGVRSANGEINPNEKFPNMKALGDSLHTMGLKFGIYSSPGPLDCGLVNIGSYQHELQDARSYAQWGVDYLKYDWCTYSEIAKGMSRQELQRPYLIMRDALSRTDRDVVYSLCQYGMGNVWEWGRDVGGNLWRTTHDINDSWESVYQIGFTQINNFSYAGPGHWNDPDMLVVGMVGWGPRLHPTRLKVNEQYSHMSLWSLLSAPLMIGADLSQLDDFTLSLLTNDEVIAINQDPLGRQATRTLVDGVIQVWVKELADGSKAVGIFNTGTETKRYVLKPSVLQLSKVTKARDLWRQIDVPDVETGLTVKLPSHGVKLIKIR
jgi:alpha-galactosidase